MVGGCRQWMSLCHISISKRIATFHWNVTQTHFLMTTTQSKIMLTSGTSLTIGVLNILFCRSQEVAKFLVHQLCRNLQNRQKKPVPAGLVCNLSFWHKIYPILLKEGRIPNLPQMFAPHQNHEVLQDTLSQILSILR